MKPLTDSQKEWFYRNLVDGPLRHLARPFYKALIAAELRWHRFTDGPVRTTQPSSLRNVTALIKTFERPDCCRALLSSIRRISPDLRVVVVDDSRSPNTWPGAVTHVLPFDSGVATGRSEGLKRVDTEYMLNLDDDFVFFNRTDIEAALQIMESHPEIDLMGGKVIDLPLYVTHESRGADIFNHFAHPLRDAGDRVGGLTVQNKVANFFLARTDRLRKVDWDHSLKRLDHADFFTRAKGRLLSVYNPSLQILHVKNPFDAEYRKFRFAIDDDLSYLSRKYAKPWPPNGEEE